MRIMGGAALLGAVVVMAMPLGSGATIATAAAGTRSPSPQASPAGNAGLLARLAAGAVEPLRTPARRSGPTAPAAASLACLTNPNPSLTAAQCYSVQQMRTAYDITPLLDSGITGKGQTIVIVALSSLPTLRSDVHAFDQLWGLSDPRLNIIAPFGEPPFIPDPTGVAADEVETAHAIAPDATIDVVESPALTGTTVEEQSYETLKPLRYAIDRRLGNVIDDDWGIAGESCFDNAFFRYQHALFQEARARHITVVASSGFHGAGSFSCPSPTAPAPAAFPVTKETSAFNDPLVTTVGGTVLRASVGTGAYEGETTWNDDSIGFGASGGGFSTVFPRPGYQDGVPGISGFRGEPDVAWDEAIETPLVIEVTINGTQTLSSSGQITGGPAWAGLVALSDQYAGRPLGFLNEGLYRILNSSFYSQAFHDVTTGGNSVTGSDINGNPVPITGYNAGPGWDPVTGLGSPRAAVLAPLLTRYVHADDGRGL